MYVLLLVRRSRETSCCYRRSLTPPPARWFSYRHTRMSASAARSDDAMLPAASVTRVGLCWHPLYIIAERLNTAPQSATANAVLEETVNSIWSSYSVSSLSQFSDISVNSERQFSNSCDRRVNFWKVESEIPSPACKLPPRANGPLVTICLWQKSPK